ncbi:MAG: hypothetical protein LBI81_02645 [Puniceicoccales bacterium]|jgi:hypothetical protein|nr:hypothetical protein [Puniceicoccales bacterium]
MKKLLTVIFLLAGISLSNAEDSGAAQASDSNFTVGTNMQFKTARVSHGCKASNGIYVAEAKIGYKIRENLKFNLGGDAMAALSGKYSRVAPGIGLSWDVTESVVLDAGYTHYFYTSAHGDEQKNSNEIYGGIRRNMWLRPAVYYFYDFDNRDISWEFSIGHEFDLERRLLPGLTLNVSAKVGFEQAEKSGGKRIENGKKYFFYYGTGADLVYAFGNNAKAKLGVAYEGNSAAKNSWVNAKRRDFVWGSASISCSF